MLSLAKQVVLLLKLLNWNISLQPLSVNNSQRPQQPDINQENAMLMSSIGNLTQTVLVTTLMVYSTLVFSADPPWLTPIISGCDAGKTQECLNAGVAYTKGEFQGNKVARDKSKAKQYIGKAVKRGQQNCLQGDNIDCYTLGLLFFEGGGIVPADIPRGLEFLQRACRGGYSQSCAWLDNSGLGKAPR